MEILNKRSPFALWLSAAYHRRRLRQFLAETPSLEAVPYSWWFRHSGVWHKLEISLCHHDSGRTWWIRRKDHTDISTHEMVKTLLTFEQDVIDLYEARVRNSGLRRRWWEVWG